MVFMSWETKFGTVVFHANMKKVTTVLFVFFRASFEVKIAQ